MWVRYCEQMRMSRMLVNDMPSKSVCCLQEGSLKQQFATLFDWTVLVQILLVENIRLTTWDFKNPLNI